MDRAARHPVAHDVALTPQPVAASSALRAAGADLDDPAAAAAAEAAMGGHRAPLGDGAGAGIRTRTPSRGTAPKAVAAAVTPRPLAHQLVGPPGRMLGMVPFAMPRLTVVTLHPIRDAATATET